MPLKILKLDEDTVYVRIFYWIYRSLPSDIDELTLYLTSADACEEVLPNMGCLRVPIRMFATWEARFVQQSSAFPWELEGCETWVTANYPFFPHVA
ncbi:hypothetical protein WQ53_06250 [Pseudoxanthomonas suwonensis]|uniref:Uncharacterized protein n=1 Tax=Pseudoxanthomonas suwonensis TaxID=314722 RepID=A0A0E3UMW6_9GAMM|nr:hypothetical protein WQ53_06250 [Pseudoxanthomonas suwonensis]